MGYFVLNTMWEPAPDTTVWRYMDLPRYVDLLQRRAFYLSRADRMQDRWEGSVGAYSRDYWKNQAAKERQPIEDSDNPLVEQMARFRKSLVRHTYMNCWHASEVESAAMWDLYDTSGRGIGVRTTWDTLASSIASPLAVTGMEVQYVDYNNTLLPVWNYFYPFGYKRESFLHEKEVRLVYVDLPTRRQQPEEMSDLPSLEGYECDTDYEELVDLSLDTPIGHHLGVDLKTLIEEVFVAPNAEDWFLDVVKSVSATYEGEWPVSRSSLADGPVY